MQFTPFPAALAMASARTGRRLQSSDHDDAGRRRRPGPLPSPYTAKSVAAYRWPDGRVGIAHDMYAPRHPEGTEPGLADVHYSVRHHPNDTSSYQPEILKFLSIAEIESAVGAPVDRMAAAMLASDGQFELLVTENEDVMTDILAQLPGTVDALRAPIQYIDFEAPGRMQRFVASFTPGGGLEIFAATEDGPLHQALAERWIFIDPCEECEDLDQFCEILSTRADRYQWILRDRTCDQVLARDIADLPDVFRGALQTSDLDTPTF